MKQAYALVEEKVKDLEKHEMSSLEKIKKTYKYLVPSL